MAQAYVRDRNYSGVTVDERLVRELHAIVTAQAGVAPQSSGNPSDAAGGLGYCIIRFDDGGFRVWQLEELLGHYDSADQVERLVFVAESNQAISTQRHLGSYAELRLDGKQGASSYMVAASDDLVWVNNTFNAFSVALQRARNNNGIVRSPIVNLVAQLIGVVLCFFVSLWAAGRMAPSLAIENAFIYCFLFALLVTSILWAFALRWFGDVLNLAFPDVRFVTKKYPGPKWLVQALVGALVIAILGLLANATWEWLASFATRLIRQDL